MVYTNARELHKVAYDQVKCAICSYDKTLPGNDSKVFFANQHTPWQTIFEDSQKSQSHILILFEKVAINLIKL